MTKTRPVFALVASTARSLDGVLLRLLVLMIVRDRHIFGMAYDIHPFAVALEDPCGEQPARHVRGDDAG